jgi:hypothetical protein
MAGLIVIFCTHVHETSHMPDLAPCPDACPSMEKGKPKPGTTERKSECMAVKQELQCLHSFKFFCFGDPACEEEVEGYFRTTRNRVKDECRLLGVDILPNE